MTENQISTLVKNVNTINSVLNGLDHIGYRDFLHGIYTDYDKLKFIHGILGDAGYYKKQVTKEMVMVKITPQKQEDEFVD